MCMCVFDLGMSAELILKIPTKILKTKRYSFSFINIDTVSTKIAIFPKLTEATLTYKQKLNMPGKTTTYM